MHKRKPFWTDYPILEEDHLNSKAPIRQIELCNFDGDKRVQVTFQGKKCPAFKSGYVYIKQGRIGQVPQISYEELLEYVDVVAWEGW